MYDELIRILEQCECSEEFIIGVLGMGATTGIRISIEREEFEMIDTFKDLLLECDTYMSNHDRQAGAIRRTRELESPSRLSPQGDTKIPRAHGVKGKEIIYD